MSNHQTQQTSNRSQNGLKAMVLSGIVLGASTLGGCAENAGDGFLSGAGIGALSGLAIGSLSGNAGKGAAIGAVAGGVGGAVIGDQNKRNRENARYQGYERDRDHYRQSEYNRRDSEYHDHHQGGGYRYDEWWNND